MHLRPKTKKAQQAADQQGRGVYTFCMCPGGEVVCAASEPGGVVVNGMSRFARDGRNANSALLVGVGPEDFDSDRSACRRAICSANMEQRSLPKPPSPQAAKPYQAPAQTVGDFLAHRCGRRRANNVRPTYARGVAWCDLHELRFHRSWPTPWPQALPLLDRRLHGFADPQAVMTGVETRSSSPVRIVRGKNLQAQLAVEAPNPDAQNAPEPETGLYPCGEGAGYAGGIMSAACDGLRVAAALVDQIMQPGQKPASSQES